MFYCIYCKVAACSSHLVQSWKQGFVDLVFGRGMKLVAITRLVNRLQIALLITGQWIENWSIGMEKNDPTQAT